jgi:hypothetical protein
MTHRMKLKSEERQAKGKLHKGLRFNDIGEAANGDRVYEVELPGGHSFRISAKNENDAKKTLDKVAK